MRKIILPLLLMLCLLLPAAALADSFTFAEQGAACSIPDSKYTVLTPENLDSMTSWLEKNNKTSEHVREDFSQRNVLLQAWSASGDVCIEITAVQDHYAQQYYDVNKVGQDERKAYRIGHSSDKTGEWRDQGYDYTSAEWQTYKYAGRFLKLEYTRSTGSASYRGIARKTVRNGWHIHIDYQVYGRKPTKTDTNALEAIMTSWEFLEVTARPSGSTSASKVIFTATPPEETNTGKYTVAGTGTSGLKVVGVVMRMSSSDVHRFETEIDQKGKFTMAVQLPKEGLWTMTYTVFNGEEVVEEGAFDPITYNDTLLSVRLNTDLPSTMTLTGNSLTISGTTLKNTKVQCIVDGRTSPKSITTNNSGTFSFTIDTSAEGLYNITLVFEKKGYDARRFRCEATRVFTDQDRQQSIETDAIKPSYTNLKKKIDSYRGRYMVYTLNIKEVIPTSTGYLTFAGMTKTKSGVYKEIVAIRTTEEPSWTAGASVRMYLKCIGMYDVVGDEGTDSYPYFDLQWID